MRWNDARKRLNNSTVNVFGQQMCVRSQLLQAIFDSQYVNALDVESTGPSITCLTSEVERIGMTKDDIVTIGDFQYRLVRHEPDGAGMSRWMLRRA